MDLSLFDYFYPPELVAQQPLAERDAARMLVCDRATGAIAHHAVRALPDFLRAGDLLIINTSKVIPARLIGKRESGGRVEVLLLQPRTSWSVVRDSWFDKSQTTNHKPRTTAVWWCLATHMHRLRVGTRLTFAQDLEGLVEAREGDRLAIRFNADDNLLTLLDRIGLPPLPPYIDRTTNHEPQTTIHDRHRYQTIYADRPGSSAAPTAGLHFSERLLDAIRARGVQIAPVTLHVGTDTFSPVRVEQIEDHQMHGETYDIPAATIAAVAAAKREGRRVIAVGTTSVRALESAADFVLRAPCFVPRNTSAVEGTKHEARGTTHIFIHPGYRFRIVDALLTNFHQPRSTLLMLVAAFAGLDTIQRAYAEAVAQQYRLFSYGDCMFIQ